MRPSAFVATGVATVVIVALPFLGGSGPSPLAVSTTAEPASTSVMQPRAPAAVLTPLDVAVAELTLYEPPAVEPVLTTDAEHLAQKPVPPPPPPAAAGSGTDGRRAARAAAGLSCPAAVGGAVGGAPAVTSAGGIAGTTSADLSSFALAFNDIRVQNCLEPVPLANFRYNACMENRLFWIAEDPSTDVNSAWGHVGTVVRSDGVADPGCDGNLAGGTGNTGAVVAQKWWLSLPHRSSLYRPTYAGSTAGVCIYFAMSHGGTNDPVSLDRASARWGSC